MKCKWNYEAIITSYNQGDYIREAVESVCAQTVLPSRIIVLDDGSTDEKSILVLEKISRRHYPASVFVCRQENAGVSSARNHGMKLTTAPYVLIMDGDDKLESAYAKKVSDLLQENSAMVAASSYMQCFGAINSVVRPDGGDITSFLSHNCCPATHILKRSAWEQCSGYDEKMRSGFEDWDFFLSLLETSKAASIGIVREPLLNYRTAPMSSNVRSMDKRIELMRYLIRKHKRSYEKHVEAAVLGIERISMYRLEGWESEMQRAPRLGNLSDLSKQFLENPSYGDGGMAAAVRICVDVRNDHVGDSGGKNPE